MAKLKRPLNEAAVKAANDEFYRRHPEMIVNGVRQPIDPDNPAHDAMQTEWIQLYISFGGDIEGDTFENVDFEMTWMPPPKHELFREGPRAGTPISAVKAQVFFARASRLMVMERWPLVEYYAYLDTELGETIDFDGLGLLWTDEKGFPHFCGEDGKPIERVEFFPFSYATGKDKGTSCVLIYDTSLSRLRQKKASLQGTPGVGSKHRVKQIYAEELPDGSAQTMEIFVPSDPEVLDIEDIKKNAIECDNILAAARDKRDELKHFMEKDPEHAVMWLHREAINGWLASGDNRKGLPKLANGKSVWDTACETFDKEFKKKSDAYEAALFPLWQKVNSPAIREKIFKCDFVVEGWEDPAGFHGWWHVHFFIEAIGMFAGTLKHQEVFETLAQPLLQGFSHNWGQARDKCKCPSCGAVVQEIDPLANVDAREHFDKLNIKLKDGKLITSTIQRFVDLATKFTANFGLIIAMRAEFSANDVSKVGFLGASLFKRSGDVNKGFFKQFAEAWGKHVEEIAKRAKDFEDHGKGLEDARKALFQKHLKLDPGKLGNAAGALGGAITIAYFFTKEGKDLKDWSDMVKGITDVAKGGIGLAKDDLAKKFAVKYGSEKAAKKALDGIGKKLGIAGGVLQLGGAWLSLRDAANKGDPHAFWWGAVQYVGADIYLTGLVVEFTPAFGVSQVAGVVIAVIGAVVYVGGQIGEFIFRPGAEEMWLRSHYYYDDGDHRTPEDKERSAREQIQRNADYPEGLPGRRY